MTAHQLIDSYHNECLVPEQSEKDSIKGQVKRIFNAYKNNTALGPKELHIAGSFAKGTMLAGRMEADIELYYPRHNVSFYQIRDEAIRVAEACFPKAKISPSDKCINIEIEKKGTVRSFDIVLGFPVNSPQQMAEVRNEQQYIVTTGEFHVEYVKRQINEWSFYPNIVRLIKDWRNVWDVPLKSIHIELLVASALHYQKIEPLNYPECLKSCFKEMMSMCDGTVISPVNWPLDDELYDAPKSDAGINIIDPANPSDNMVDYLDSDDVTTIRRQATRAINLINNEDWRELWQDEFFD